MALLQASVRKGPGHCAVWCLAVSAPSSYPHNGRLDTVLKNVDRLACIVRMRRGARAGQ